MALIPLDIPPGFQANVTPYQAKNRWVNGNLVRFYEGRIRPIGGWTRLSDDRLEDGSNELDPARGMHSFRLSTGIRRLIIGTTTKLYKWDGGDDLVDISPTTISQTSSTITGLGYGTLEYGGDVGVNGGTTEGGGTWGTPREVVVEGSEDVANEIFVPVWHIDNLGDVMLACGSGDGKIYRWEDSAEGSPTPSTDPPRSTVLTNAPTGNVGVIVTPERHIMCLAPGGDTRKIQWASQGTLTDWSPTVTNTARSITLQTRGEIITARKSRYGTLVFCSDSVYRLNYVGPPYVYSVERLTEGANPLGAKAVAGSADILAWMSNGRFWTYQGGYIKEVQSSVSDHVFRDINTELSGLIVAYHNADFGEIWWSYPVSGSTTQTRYVIWSYKENHWAFGELERTAWEDQGTFGYPIGAGADGYLYRHEMQLDPNTDLDRASGLTIPTTVSELSSNTRSLARNAETVTDAEHLCFAETGAIELGQGGRLMSVRQILTDTDAGTNGLRLKYDTAFTPDSNDTTRGPFSLNADGYTDVRFTARQIKFKVEGPYDTDWRLGDLRIDAVGAGKR